MSWLDEGIMRDTMELQSLFHEKIELKFYDLGKTYSKLALVSIEDTPVEEKTKPVFYFYRDDIYIDFDKRDPDYKGTLVAFDYGGQSYTAKYFYSQKLKKSTSGKLSIYDVIRDLYANTHR
ncbi:hypothetical protein [Alkalihalobacillus sp. BA299]|uniref:hypothetical protein n=1 Tax=Alkalihalobacillus sp. BA299 TaxID=2815938 RepID=UPI001ADA0548|nr:hypothetical protein [Alkalihalobacillus sp. BA299]